MARGDETSWSGLAQQLMDSMHGLKAGHGSHPKDMEMRGEINALHVLHHHPEGVTPTVLARACQVSTARITKTIDQLEGRGLVERRPSPKDRRSVTVRLTEAGETEIAQRSKRINGYLEQILRELGEKDARELVRLSTRIAEIVSAHAQTGYVGGCPLGGDGADEAR